MKMNTPKSTFNLTVTLLLSLSVGCSAPVAKVAPLITVQPTQEAPTKVSDAVTWSQGISSTGCTYLYPSSWVTQTFHFPSADAYTGERIDLNGRNQPRLPFGLARYISIGIGNLKKPNDQAWITRVRQLKIGMNGDGFTSTHWVSQRRIDDDIEEFIVVNSQTTGLDTVNAPSFMLARYSENQHLAYSVDVTNIDVRSYLLAKHLGWKIGIEIAEPELISVFKSIDCSKAHFPTN